jgi:TonB family protein
MKILAWSRIFPLAATCLIIVSMSFAPARAQNALEYEPPTVISTAEALYPINSVASGTVILEVNLDKRGTIDEVSVFHGIASLAKPAITAVKKWKFGPAKLDGYGVSSKIPVAFTFVPPSTAPRI